MLQDLSVACRSLARAKGLCVTIVVTLALGIGANAAIFSVVRGVLLRPLVNRDESRLIYIRQSAPGIAADNATFSVPEIGDLRDRTRTLSAIAEFSTVTFTMVGLGEPRQVRAGVVSGNYFEVMGLRPAMGRLLTAGDDGPSAAGVAVVSHRFWRTGLQSDPAVVGKTVHLGPRAAVIVGVLEPSVPYPSETELIANMVTSPHHLSATMVTGREHRMTEIFARLAPGAALESARAELQGIHAGILSDHPEAYAAGAAFRIDAVRLRDQITARARPVLVALLAASALVFLIACSNVANLILARTVRREGELAMRAALGAGKGRLRRMLLAESLLLCGTGSLIGVLIARPMVAVLARYASRFSIRALDLTLDGTLLVIGVAMALAAAVFLAFIPKLPSAEATHGFGLTSGGVRISGATSRRLRAFAVTQVAASFVLLAGSGLLLVTLRNLQAARSGIETAHVLAIDVPVVSFGRTPEQVRGFYRDMVRRVATLPGVASAALGGTVPWRDDAANTLAFSVEGHRREDGASDPRARYRSVSPGFFTVLGIPLLAGREFTDADRNTGERVVIISASVARQLFPGRDALNQHVQWTDGLARFIGVAPEPRRIVGVAADLDDARIDPLPVMTIYHPFDQDLGRRLFVRTFADPYALVPLITRTVRELYKDQPVERAATLDDIRSEVLTPQRLNTIVFGGFALVALTIALVGVAGVLAFSISARTREFGIRIAIGSPPRNILARVMLEGLVMAVLGVAAGAAGGFALVRWLGSYVPAIGLPGALPVTGAAVLLVLAAVLASLVPAARAARVDVVRALRAE